MAWFSRFNSGAAAFLVSLVVLFPLSAQDTNGPASTNAAPFFQDNPTAPAPATTPDTPDITMPSAQPAGTDADPTVGSGELADHLLVVFNSSDPDSRGLADYYATRRHIPPERVFALTCPVTEEITRGDFEETIRRPIVSYLSEKNWLVRQNVQGQVAGRSMQLLAATSNDIWAIVLMRGVPLKIAPDPSNSVSVQTEPIFQTNAACVDSELALLPVYGLPWGGFVPNPFLDPRSTGLKRVGPDSARQLTLVTRLDAPQAVDVRRMIDDTLYAEEHRLAGLAVLDSRGITDPKGAYVQGDIWLRKSRDLLLADGWLVQFDDSPFVLPPTDPCNQVALYLGWYGTDASGPWVTAPDRFVRGAIAYHLHSFSASTVRSATSNWVGPLIAHGAAATMGDVYEPYLGLTPHLDIFTKRLLDGNYFAEAAYACQPGLSWMTTVIGDPLYRPFLQPLTSLLAGMSDTHTDHDDWILLQQMQKAIRTPGRTVDADLLKRNLAIPGASAIACEALGDLLVQLKDPTTDQDIIDAYTKARIKSALGVDRVRIGMKLIAYYHSHNQEDRARNDLILVREMDPVEAKRFGPAPDATVPGPQPAHGTITAGIPKSKPPLPPQPVSGAQ